MTTTVAAPSSVRDVEQLEELLSRPTPASVATMSKLDGDIIVLGIGGKMGPTLARMARRASDAAGIKRRIIGVARFSDGSLQEQLHNWNIESIKADLLNPEDVKQLPGAPNVLYMTGMKFGSTGNEGATWAMNTSVPTLVSLRYPGSKVVMFSSGNVYPLVPVTSGGSKETDEAKPVAEYGMSVLGRERVFEYYAKAHRSPTAILRLNYATEMRYGVLVDLATWVNEGRPIDLSMGYVNVIWQGDANAMTLRAFDHVSVPAKVINMAGVPVLRLREVAERFGKMMGKTVSFTGTEAADALLNDGRAGQKLLGEQTVSSDQLIEWIGDWVKRGGKLLGKPTHFENRAGKF